MLLFWIDSKRFRCTRNLSECTKTNVVWYKSFKYITRYLSGSRTCVNCGEDFFTITSDINLNLFNFSNTEGFGCFSSEGEEHLFLIRIKGDGFSSTTDSKDITKSNIVRNESDEYFTRNFQVNK